MQGWKALIARIEILSPKIENLNSRDMITLVAALLLSLPNAATGFARVNTPSVDPGLDKEALRLVVSMPKWTPGRQNGKAERVKYTVPVTFRLK